MARKIDRIVLVDDDNITNYVNKGVIQKLDLAKEVVVRLDGRQALDYIQNECKDIEGCTSLILLDLKMPVCDGFDFLSEFQKLPRNIQENMIIVILTTSQSGDDIIRLRKLGNYFLVNKPLTAEKLTDIYHRYFRNITLQD